MQWLDLNQLPYCNIVHHVPLGMMHNWLEGILQHHFQIRWGFDTWLVQNQKRKNTDTNSLPNKYPKVQDDSSNMSIESDDSSEESKFECKNFNLETGLFSEQQIKHFKEIQEAIILPSQLEQPPQPLGDCKSGNWKANHWNCLFEYIIPLVVTEMFVQNPS